jgi:hypothetical protein
MNLDYYSYTANKNFTDFEFVSKGPRGSVKKVVQYEMGITEEGSLFFNLSFGDWNEVTQSIDDLAITNNEDTIKILSTIASTAIVFINKYGNCPINIKGSTPSRTRLYQMQICKYHDQVTKLFDIYGLSDTGWELFRKNKNYIRFVAVKRKT